MNHIMHNFGTATNTNKRHTQISHQRQTTQASLRHKRHSFCVKKTLMMIVALSSGGEGDHFIPMF